LRKPISKKMCATSQNSQAGGRRFARIPFLRRARRERWRVTPNCSYAAAYIQRHPEYADLVSGGA
jgi:hypothetical protein